MRSIVSGVGVLDKSMVVLNAVAEEKVNLSELVEATGLPRATAHRLASALVEHDLLRRTTDGRFALGLHLLTLGRHAAEQFPLAERATEALTTLRERTGESVQLYVVDGDERVCVAALESPHGLRTIVPVGAALSMEKGSAASALRGELDVPRTGRGGWSSSVQEREPGVASVSAPVRSTSGRIMAAVSVSGPIDRMGTSPGDRHGAAVVAAARQIEATGSTA